MSSARGGREQLCITACLALVNSQLRTPRKERHSSINGKLISQATLGIASNVLPVRYLGAAGSVGLGSSSAGRWLSVSASPLTAVHSQVWSVWG